MSLNFALKCLLIYLNCNYIKGIEHLGVGPVVFYKGFTRAYLSGDTDDSETMLNSIKTVLNTLETKNNSGSIKTKPLITIIDGVGYPSVGSICNISNAHVAKAVNAPILLIGNTN